LYQQCLKCMETIKIPNFKCNNSHRKVSNSITAIVILK
jgi:hypothetical protein